MRCTILSVLWRTVLYCTAGSNTVYVRVADNAIPSTMHQLFNVHATVVDRHGDHARQRRCPWAVRRVVSSTASSRSIAYAVHSLQGGDGIDVRCHVLMSDHKRIRSEN